MPRRRRRMRRPTAARVLDGIRGADPRLFQVAFLGVFLAFFLAALGLAVVRKVGRLDISLAYLGAHAALRLARVLWLHQRLAVFEHGLMSGTLIIFAFFMISDPRSTPDTRRGRVAFAGLV